MKIRTYLVTYILLILNLVVFAIMIGNGISFIRPASESLIDWGSSFDAFIFKGEWWRLVTAMFIHAGIMHLAFNMITLFLIGKMFESNAGSLQMFLIYFMSGITGNIISCWVHLFQVGCGASGAIFGIAGAQLAMSLMNKDKFETSQRSSIIPFIILNIVLNLVIKEFDLVAHFSGLVTGFIIMFLFELISRTNNRLTSFAVSYGIIFFITGILAFAFYYNCAYRYGYFSMFQSFIANDKETLRILNNPAGFKNRFVSKTNIKSVDDIWKTNLKMLKLFRNVPGDLKSDIALLKWYMYYRRQSLVYFNRYIDTDEMVYLDSIDYTLDKINSLPPIKYKIGYHLQDDDTSDHLKLTDFTEYYDSSWIVIPKPDEAVFYRNAKRDSVGNVNGMAHDYYRSGRIQMKGRYENGLKNGAFFYFNENGNYESYGSYRIDNMVGIWKYFYPDGQPESVWNFTTVNNFLISYWDKNGNQLVAEGKGLLYTKNKNGLISETGNYNDGLKEGVWKGFYESGKPFYLEKYSHGKLILGESIDREGIRHNYMKEYESVFPLNLEDHESYLDYLKKNIIYPVRARTKKIEGVVIVQFDIDTSGFISNLIPVSKLGFGCDEEAIRVIRNGPKFKPAKHRGIKVAASEKVPVMFSLKN